MTEVREIPILLSGVGAVLVLVGLALRFHWKWTRRHCTCRTVGIVVEMYDANVYWHVGFPPEGRFHSPSYRPVFEFVAEGETYRMRSAKLPENPPRYRVGQTVTIFYDPGDPEFFYVDGEGGAAPTLIILAGCAVLAAALFALVFFGVT